jgi:hypothetical protein
MIAKCPACGTDVAEPASTQKLPSVATVSGEKGVMANVSIYKCGCGHSFTSIDYKRNDLPPLTNTSPPSAQ